MRNPTQTQAERIAERYKRSLFKLRDYAKRGQFQDTQNPLVFSFTPTPEFWKLWHADKDFLKQLGFSVTKDRDTETWRASINPRHCYFVKRRMDGLPAFDTDAAPHARNAA